ncbi:uncharacterized protein LOC113004282 [Solenopsis invicta]|uniref:uncharacterized protein LOC113004282 n=1 Tax=Solenopsis invicta TaxID=13686 RepID=UPI00193EBD26|nr:uncharacterized protein LOC113004282 [Solenopsis invicta]
MNVSITVILLDYAPWVYKITQTIQARRPSCDRRSCVELKINTKMATTKAEFNSGHAHDKDYLRGKTIDEFFAGTMILLTGATGFLGKALLEKLLHSCPVAAIFVLMRPKKDKTIEQRFEELLNDPVRIYMLEYTFFFNYILTQNIYKIFTKYL